MEMICPDCEKPMMVMEDGKTARCIAHGGTYQILFSRRPAAVVASPETPPVIAAPPESAARICANHPHLAAAFVCRDCGRLICTICAAPQPGGSRLCPSCSENVPGATPPLLNLAGKKCVQHPAVDAARSCKMCSAPMCPTCDFVLPGNFHLCPRCVVAPPKALSTGRKRVLIAAYIMAVWNTTCMMLFMSGVFNGFARSDRALLGLIFSVLIFIPSIIGAALGVSIIDRRLSNPPAVWGAAIWNCIIMGILLLLVVIGNFK